MRDGLIWKCIKTIRDLIKSTLETVRFWTKENELGVNESKTELILFTRKYKSPSFRVPRLDGIIYTVIRSSYISGDNI